MEEYYVIVMSIDPMENPEDNHQKYGVTVMATSEKDAEAKASAEITRRGLPVYWAKAN